MNCLFETSNCFKYINCFSRVNFKTSGRTTLVSVVTDHMNSLKEVKKEINKQTRGKEITLCYHPVPEAHFSAMMQR